MSRPKKGRGGKREGAGRPRLGDVPLSCSFRVRLDPLQFAALERLGGASWFRALLNGYVDREPSEPAAKKDS